MTSDLTDEHFDRCSSRALNCCYSFHGGSHPVKKLKIYSIKNIQKVIEN